ncbi:Rap ran-GAP domain containing protein [Aphelenchoides besseyi]|nr:Rap ran-GAP domain containing protein [Aphelenchoides besseyi]
MRATNGRRASAVQSSSGQPTAQSQHLGIAVQRPKTSFVGTTTDLRSQLGTGKSSPSCASKMLTVSTEKLSTSQSSVDPLSGSASSLHLNHMASAVGAGTSSSATNPESSASPSATSGGDGDTHATSAKDDSNNQLCAYHDCNSLAAGWGLGLGPAGTSFEGPTGASQAQSPSEEGDGKSNELLASCPAFRNELGTEPIRRIGLSRPSVSNAFPMSRPPDETTSRDSLETWQREHTAAEAGILEDVSNVYLGGRLCAARQPKTVIEPQDIGSYYFRHCFASRSHIDYFGTDDTLGPMAISMVRETSERKERSGIVSNTLYRLIIRISDVSVMRVAVPEEALPDVAPDKSSRSLMRELLELVCPQIHFGCLRPALPGQKVEDMLLKIDEQPIYTRYKVGVLYCRAGQSTEEQMYNNEHSSPALEEFLDFLGQRVRLRGFDAYKGGLDTKSDTTGEYSIYTEYHSHEIMFHVSTMLPFTPNNRQQLSRKRHIGNDMVTVIFQEPGALPFSPITVRSHFQHVFIIVRVNSPCTDNVSYGVAVSRAKDVPAFGPPIRRGATYQKCAEFHDFLLTKIINAENAVHRSTKFAAMAARTRREALKDLAENHVMSHPNEGPSRIASRFLGGSVKRGKERQQPKPVLGPNVRGALSWLVDVHDHSFNRRISCVLGVSAENIVLLEMPLGTVVFATPTHSVLGWANTEVGLKMYYDHGEMLLMRCCTTEGTDRELNALLKRLEAVTNGEEAKEILLRRSKTTDSLGFHVQEEGVITDVEMYQTAWKAGLRQGSRIVEIEGCAVVALTHDQLTTLLDERMQLRLMMIAPSSDGNPRRGCEDPHCPAIKGQEVQILTPETFAKAPLTYHEMFKIRNKELSTSPHNSPSGSFEERHFNFTAKTQDQRKEQVGSPDTVNVQEQQRLLKKTSTTSSTSPNFKPVASLSHQHSDADMREIIQAIEEFKFDAELPIQFEDDISRYRWHLQRLYKEKKETEKQAEFLRSQLSTEKRSHENTRKQLELLQRYCARLSQNQPEGDEVL